MNYFRQTQSSGGDHYQFYLVQNLINSLGRDGAQEACRRKDWMETLKIIRRVPPQNRCH